MNFLNFSSMIFWPKMFHTPKSYTTEVVKEQGLQRTVNTRVFIRKIFLKK